MTGAADRQRLDVALVARGLVETRSRARDLVLRGLVSVDGRTAARPSEAVRVDTILAVADVADARWVARSGVKLAAALAHFGFEVRGRVGLDVGASTGGFTDVLLDAGAARVYAVDVGQGQLHPRLRQDPRVVVLEKTDARVLDPTLVPEPVGAVVADVSFISLLKVLDAPLALAAPGAWLVGLVKPQFEVGPDGVGRGGIVRDAGAREAVVEGVTRSLAGRVGWRVLGHIVSPLTGSDGNQEFLVGAVLHG